MCITDPYYDPPVLVVSSVTVFARTLILNSILSFRLRLPRTPGSQSLSPSSKIRAASLKTARER